MKKIITALCFATVILMASVFAHAEDPTQAPASPDNSVAIYDVEGLFAIANDPAGSYILMNDIDMTGIDWTPIAFTGTFDGAGHALLNLTITKVTEETRVVYDGNMKSYNSTFAGLFGILEDATVKDVSLVGLNIDLDITGDCFAGGICGYATNSTISGCTVKGSVSLLVEGKMFGVAGLAAFGYGTISGCTADVTLVNIDKDAATKDEQFMGGAFGDGYFNVIDCNVTIYGYISDHGYVHSGGLIGMNMYFPTKKTVVTTISGNTVAGEIHFFEDNKDRRAYCAGLIGEDLNSTSKKSNNTYPEKAVFRKEVTTYTKNLLPHDCEETDDLYTTEAVASSCEDFGYTLHTCKNCGYSYKAEYTLKAHTLTADYEAVVAPTLESIGLGKFTCSTCGAAVYNEVPMLTPTPTPTPTPEPTPTFTPTPTPAPVTQAPTSSVDDSGFSQVTLSGLAQGFIYCIGIMTVVTIVLITVVIFKKKNK